MAIYTYGSASGFDGVAYINTTSNPSNIIASGETFIVTKPAWSVRSTNVLSQYSSRYYRFGRYSWSGAVITVGFLNGTSYNSRGQFSEQSTNAVSNNDTWATLPSSSTELYTSGIFTSSNSNVRTVTLVLRTGGVETIEGSFSATTAAIDAQADQNLGTCTVTLNVPPTFDVVDEDEEPTTQVWLDTPSAYSGITTASIGVKNISAKYGGDISSVAFAIGNQTVTGTTATTQTLSIPLSAAGTLTPTVSVTDSRGQTTTKSLDPITVNSYVVPSTSFTVERTNDTGAVDDEGESAVITTKFDWTEAVTTIEEPTIVAKDPNNLTVSVTNAWYKDRALTTPIVDWSEITEDMQVYCLLDNAGHNAFNTQSSYEISVTPIDGLGGSGTTITQTLGSAFYTVDFLAGGHGIAFGQPCAEDGFWCGMNSYFNPLIGVVQMYAGQTAPNGWLKCDGSAVSRTTYAKLFAVIGTTYGSGDGSTTFNLPNLQGRVPVGTSSSYALGDTGGSPDAIIVRHTHTLSRTTDVGVAAHGITQPAFTIPNHTHKWKGWNGLKSASSGTTKEVKSRSAISTDPEDNATTSSGGGGACTRTTNVALTNNHSVTQPVFSASYTGTSGAEVGANMQPYVVMNYIIHVGVPTPTV